MAWVSKNADGDLITAEARAEEAPWRTAVVQIRTRGGEVTYVANTELDSHQGRRLLLAAREHVAR